MDNSKTQQPLNLGRLPINGIILEDNQHRYKLPGEEREGAIRSFANGFISPFRGLYNGIDECIGYVADFTCSGYDIAKEKLTRKKPKNLALYDNKKRQIVKTALWIALVAAYIAMATDYIQDARQARVKASGPVATQHQR